MTTYGITTAGFVAKTLADIKAEIEDALKTTFGDSINLQPESVFGQIVGIFSERESLIWELAEATYDSQYPESAENISLDFVLALTGLIRLSALESVVIGQALFGTATTVIPAGTGFSVSGDPDAKFQTIEQVVLGTGTDEVQTIGFSATPTGGSFKLNYNGEITAAILYSEGSTEVQTALNALASLSGVTVSGSFAADFVVTFAGDDGKQEQAILVEDSNTLTNGGAVTITITETTPGVYQAQVDCQAISTGPTVANAKTLTVIDNPVSGLTRVFNPADAVIGRDIETDSEARNRRRNRLQISLAGPLEAVRTALLKLNDDVDAIELESVVVFENITNTTDARGIPPKAFEAFIYQAGGATTRDQEIADAIWESKPAGIEPHGDVSKSITDSQGLTHTVKFSRPTEIDIYLILDLTVTSDYPADGDDQVEAIMVAWGNALGVGQDVIVFPELVAQLSSTAIPGITDIVVKIGTAPSPTLDNNVIIDDGTSGSVEISRWDTARITVNS
jgi:uncharacterized phage protein gp47/JayE